MQVNLQSRAADLARQLKQADAPATDEQLQQIATDTGASVGDVRKALLTQLQALDAGSAAAQQAGDRSADLRSALGDGVGQNFQGQRTADASTTPSLKGFNLQVAGEGIAGAKSFVDDVSALANKAASGDAAPAEIQEALNKLADVDVNDTVKMWEPGNEQLVSQLATAFDKLGDAAPEATFGGRSILETRAAHRMNMAAAAGRDGVPGADAAMALSAGQLIKEAPDSPLRAWADNSAVFGTGSTNAGTRGLEHLAEKGGLPDSTPLSKDEIAFITSNVTTSPGQEPTKATANMDPFRMLDALQALADKGGFTTPYGECSPQALRAMGAAVMEAFADSDFTNQSLMNAASGVRAEQQQGLRDSVAGGVRSGLDTETQADVDKALSAHTAFAQAEGTLQGNLEARGGSLAPLIANGAQADAMASFGRDLGKALTDGHLPYEGTAEMGDAQTQLEMNMLAAEAFSAVDEKMSAVVDKLKADLSPEDAADLDAAQAAFADFRDATATLAGNMEARGGSLAPLIASSSAEGLTRDRLDQLEAMLDG